MGMDNLRAAWEACPTGCVPVILGDLNIDSRDPQNKREELIVDLLDNINLINTSRRYTPGQPRKHWAWWTWRHKREGRTHYFDPDYIFASRGDARQIWNIVFR